MRIVRRHWPIVALWTVITTSIAMGPLKQPGNLEGIAYIDLPGIVFLIGGWGVHGGYGGWRDDAIIVIGSTVPWSLATIALVEIWRFMYRKSGRRKWDK